jgi:hypothetical protein
VDVLGHGFLFSNRQAFKVSDVLNDPIIKFSREKNAKHYSEEGHHVGWDNPIPWEKSFCENSRFTEEKNDFIDTDIPLGHLSETIKEIFFSIL